MELWTLGFYRMKSTSIDSTEALVYLYAPVFEALQSTTPLPLSVQYCMCALETQCRRKSSCVSQLFLASACCSESPAIECQWKEIFPNLFKHTSTELHSCTVNNQKFKACECNLNGQIFTWMSKHDEVLIFKCFMKLSVWNNLQIQWDDKHPFYRQQTNVMPSHLLFIPKLYMKLDYYLIQR